MAAYRVSFIKASGWTRLGLAGAVGVLFSTPMLWALGSFGFADEALHRAIVFALSGVWCPIAVGYLVGWAVTGFMVKIKDGEGEEKESRRPEIPHRPTIPAPPPAGRPPQH